MFNKTFFVALLFCACYLGATWARPQLPQLPQLPIPGAEALPIGSVGSAVGSAIGAATGGLAGGSLVPQLPLGGQKKLL
ncbi:uncharacterized protein LOC111594813 [Drosophila hydei]|uniref:Uncharacterized protein LOC111594813 n=1 Tax=Drosophila hydei TaxID=7224 RepID=A0A6J1LKY8_DROHY|nr:uncharacterized protein LOC111594813 [Drosophila hydei]